MSQDIGVVLLGIATADRTEMKLIQDAFKSRWASLTLEEAGSFSVGQKVSFNGSSGVIEAVVEKINRKSISVKCTTHDWMKYRVSPSLLTVIA
jgi:hypothetical protein